MFRKHSILLLLVIGLLCACSTRSVEQAQRVVAQADSLWAVGASYDDSLSLAQACETLDRWQWFNADDYAHACYHYGRLLRAKDHPVEAMQVFINATHSRTHDYHILGRVYSNMGSICHLAGEYPLSYDMYSRSAEVFLQKCDTISYYYLLNDMALESALMKKKDASLSLVKQIEDNCSNSGVLSKTLETKAELYLKSQQYDSAIYYASEIAQTKNTIGLLIQAQAYSRLGRKDSAVYYAEQVLHTSRELSDINNALYILTNDDVKRDKDAIREAAANRADIQKVLKYKQGELAQAVQLLEQDINRKPDLRWLYAIIATILCVGGMFYWRYYVRKRQMHSQIEQFAERQVDIIMQSIKQHININDLDHTFHWRNYAAMKADADLYMGGIVNKLESKNLNETEIRFCILTMLDFSLSHIAETIHYGYPSGIKTLKKRVSVKLGTTPPNLRNFLFHMASNV